MLFLRPALPTVAPQHPKPTTTGAPSLIRRRPIVDASFNQDTLPSQSGHRRPSHYDKTLKPSRAGSVHVGHMRWVSATFSTTTVAVLFALNISLHRRNGHYYGPPDSQVSASLSLRSIIAQSDFLMIA